MALLLITPDYFKIYNRLQLITITDYDYPRPGPGYFEYTELQNAIFIERD